MAYNRRQNNRGNNQDRDETPRYDALVVQEPRLPMPAQDLLAQFNIDRSAWQALTDAVFPSAKTVAGVMLALSICKARKLDVFKRVVHVVPMWSSKYRCEIETIWPGIAEARITATRTGVYAGTDPCKFGRIIRRSFEASKSYNRGNDEEPGTTMARCSEIEFPETAQMTVYKIVAGVRCAFVGPEVSFVEMFSGQKGLRVPNDRWQQAPKQMLEKCAEAAALRRAFPEELGNEWFAEEMDGKVMHGDIDGRGVVIDQPAQESTDQQHGGQRQHPEDAQFENVDDGNNHQDGGQQQGEPQFWGPDQVEAFRQFIESGLTECRTIKRVNNARQQYDDSVQMLAPDDRKMIEDMFEARRVELTSKPKDEPKQADTEQQQGGQQAEQRAAGEPPFLRNLRREVDEIDTQIELSSFESSLRRQLEAEAPEIAERARGIIADRREALRQSA